MMDKLGEIKLAMATADICRRCSLQNVGGFLNSMDWLVAEVERLRPLARLGELVEALPEGWGLERRHGEAWEVFKGYIYIDADTAEAALLAAGVGEQDKKEDEDAVQ